MFWKKTRKILRFILIAVIIIGFSWFALKGLKEKKISEDEPVEWTVNNSLIAKIPHTFFSEK